jgi:trigger factor
MIDEQAESMKKDMTQRMSQSGLTFEQYLQFVGQKEEEFMAKLKEDAKKDITNYFLLEEVGHKEGLQLTDADVEFEYAKLAEQYKMSIDDVKKALSAQLDQFKNNLRMTRQPLGI